MARGLGAKIPANTDPIQVLSIASAIPLECFNNAKPVDLLNNLEKMDLANMNSLRKSYIASKVMKIPLNQTNISIVNNYFFYQDLSLKLDFSLTKHVAILF